MSLDPPTNNPSSSSQRLSAPSSHRLPTISASQAIQDLKADGPEYLSTGLGSLDDYLLGDASSESRGGFERGKVTEIWGPVGAGKTALILQSAVTALRHGNNVIWVDSASPLNRSRLQIALQRDDDAGDTEREDDLLSRFHHKPMRTLSHLLTFVLHAPPRTIPDRTSLLIIEGFNTLIDLNYPRLRFSGSAKSDAQRWQSGRRYAILGSLINGLNKLSVLHHLALVITTGCASRSRSDVGLGSALAPGVGGSEWETGVWNRLAVFRDLETRFVGIQKCRGKSLISHEEVGDAGRLFAFDIHQNSSIHETLSTGDAEPTSSHMPPPIHQSPVKQRKRFYDEVADSDEEEIDEGDEYGWIEAEADDVVLAVAERPAKRHITI